MLIRLITYNIHKGFSLANLDYTLELIKGGLQKSGADIVCLQEVCGRQSHFDKARLSKLVQQFEYLADGHWKDHSYGKNAIYSSGDHGNAVLSHFPIVSFQNTNLSLHRFEQRGLLHCKLKIVQSKNKGDQVSDPQRNQQSEHLSTLHVFTSHLNLLARHRKIQIEKVMHQISSTVAENDSVIFCGDFNDWKHEISKTLLSKLNLSEAFLSLHGRHAKSFPSFFPMLSLDRVYYRGLKALKAETLEDPSWAKLSDHLPLLVKFEL